MKKLINSARDVVPEMLTGLALGNPGISLLAGGTVAIRSDVDEVRARGEVAVLSGGGAGHEPAHAGYVGAGMLTAAVSGDVFTSPSTDAVLTAIKAAATSAGALLVVKNYTGDRLNFGLAAELARAEGIPVEMVIVADDVALASNDSNAGRRGIAGTVLVHKVAGAAAAAGHSLDEVAKLATQAIEAVGSMGVALSSCTVPAAGRPGFELGDDEIELGLGIHGEAGVARTKIASADELAATILDKIVTDRGLGAGDRVAVLVNNLGGTPSMELNIVTRQTIKYLSGREIQVERLWTGGFLTALEMAGCSLSVLRVNDRLLELLDAPTTAPAWPASHLGRVRAVGTENLRDDEDTASATPVDGGQDADPGLSAALEAVCATLTEAEPRLTELDQAVGDGDLGISLARGAEAIRAEFPTYGHHDPAGDLRDLSATLRRALGGTSGPLYAILVLRAANTLEGRAVPYTPADWAEAFAAGVQAITDLGGARIGDRTMVDALVPAVEVLTDAYANSDADVKAGLAKAIEAAERGTAATADIEARRGRSSYLGDRALGHVDPGAEAVTLWLKAILSTVD